MILVTGATGHVGMELVAQLASAGQKVRAMTRRPEAARFPAGVEIVRGDFDAPESLHAAALGADRMFLLTTQTTGDPQGTDHARRMVEAARQAGVRHIVKLSVLGGGAPRGFDDPIVRWHRGIEATVTESGIGWTLLRPGRFMSNALQWAAMIREGGTVRTPFGDRAAASIDPWDIAAVAVRALLEPERHRGKAYELSGPQSLTPREEVAILSEVLGRRLELVGLPSEIARPGMLRAGMPPEVVDAIFERAENTDHGTEVLPTVQEITGQPPRRFDQWARAHADAFR